MPFVETLVVTAVTTLLSVALALLAPSPAIENAKAANFDDFDFPRVDEGVPIPFIFGRTKVNAPTVLFLSNFIAEPITRRVRVSPFKKKTQVIGYKYFIDIDLALGLGPGINLHKIYVTDKDVVYTNDSGVTSDASFTVDNSGIFGGEGEGGGILFNCQFFTGSFTQAKPTGLTGIDETLLPAYRGLSHIAIPGAYIGDRPSLTKWSFEVSQFYDNLGLGASSKIGNDDCNPVEVLYTILISQWAGLGVAASDIDATTFTAAATTVFNEGLGVSGQVAQSSDPKDVIEELLRVIDGLIYEDPTTGKIVLTLIREDYTVGSLPTLDETNIISVADFSRSTWAETTNQLRGVYKSREQEYSSKAAILNDLANVSMTGSTRSNTVQLPFVKLPGVANTVVTRDLKAISLPLISATLVVNREATTYFPGSVVKVNLPSRGVSNLVMRVQKYDLGTLDDSAIKLELMQDRFAVSGTVFADPPDTFFSPITDDASDVTTYKLLEAPRFLVNRAIDQQLATSAADSHLYYLPEKPSAANVAYLPRVSEDNGTTYGNDNDYTLFAPTARLAAAYTEQGTDEYDTSVGINIDTVSDTSALTTQAVIDIRAGEGLILINDEILAYESFTDLGGGSYRLNNVWRGCLDTVPANHADNDVVYFINTLDHFGENNFTGDEALDVKFISRTGTNSLPESSATTREITLANRPELPLPVDNLLIEGDRFPVFIAGSNINFSWARRDKTNDTVHRSNDSDETPATTTTYKIDYQVDGGSVLSNDFGAAASGAFNFGSTGVDITLNFYSMEGVTSSLFPIARSFSIIATEPSSLKMLDLPLLSGSDDLSRASSRLYFAVDTAAELQEDKGSGYVTTGDTVTTGTCIGQTVNAITSVARPFTTDTTNSLTVSSTTNVSLLQSITRDQMLQGQNRAALIKSSGVEIIAFQTVTSLGGDQYQLDNLLRGLRGTDTQTGGNSIGDEFIFLGNQGSTQLALGELNTSIDYRAKITGQDLGTAPTDTNVSHTGRDLKPYAITRPGASIDGSNNITITWERRSRVEPNVILNQAALEEDSEEYEIEIYDGMTLVRTVTGLSSATYTYTATDQTSDGFTPPLSSLKVKIFQISGQVARGFSEEVTLSV